MTHIAFKVRNLAEFLIKMMIKNEKAIKQIKLFSCHFPDEYLNPNTTASIRMALIKQIMHFDAYLLSAHSSALFKC